MCCNCAAWTLQYSSPYRHDRDWLLNFLWAGLSLRHLLTPSPNARSAAKALFSKTERRAEQCRRRA